MENFLLKNFHSGRYLSSRNTNFGPVREKKNGLIIFVCVFNLLKGFPCLRDTASCPKRAPEERFNCSEKILLDVISVPQISHSNKCLAAKEENQALYQNKPHPHIPTISSAV